MYDLLFLPVQRTEKFIENDGLIIPVDMTVTARGRVHQVHHNSSFFFFWGGDASLPLTP
jgi:hypothetical protein